MLEMLALKSCFLLRKGDSVYYNYLNLVVGICLYKFSKCSRFSHVLHFLLSLRQGLLECGLPPRLVHILLLLLAVNFSCGFRNAFLKFNPTSSVTEEGLLPDEKPAKAIA